MENTLFLNALPYDCDMTNLKNQQVFEKYQTWLEKCDIQESIDACNKGLNIFEEFIKGPLNVLTYKERGCLSVSQYPEDRDYCDYLLSKNKKNLMPLLKISLKNNIMNQNDRDQEFNRMLRTGDGIIGLCFDKPLESELDFTLYASGSKWEETLLIPHGTLYYKLPRFICTDWLKSFPLKVKGTIPGTTLLLTVMSPNDRDLR